MKASHARYFLPVWPQPPLRAFSTLFTPAPAQAQPATLSDADQACLGCHGSAGLDKKLENSETLQLHVPAEPFAKSVHSVIGCASCHSDISLDSHPPSKKDIKSSREYSLASAEVCKTCHADKFEQWEKSVHAALVRDGNPIAPVCTDCHAPHAVIKGASENLDTVPCKTCHGAIFTAYQSSVHGKARAAGNVVAPVCSGCHRAHEVTAASMGDGVKDSCLGCHAGALDAHAAWLPNAALHFEVISCPACHAPTAQRRVDLRLTDSATQTRVTEQHGVPLFESRARSAANGQGLDAVALYSLLKTFNREGMEGKTTPARPPGGAHRRRGASAHPEIGRDQRLSHLPPPGLGYVPERHRLGRGPRRPADPGRRRQGRAEFRDLHRLREWLLRDRRHPHPAARHRADPGATRRAVDSARPHDARLVPAPVVQAAEQRQDAFMSGGHSRCPPHPTRCL